jgi:hypothetical protein
MVKRREPQASAASKPQPTPEAIEAFASGADGGTTPKQDLNVTLDPEANRDYKAIRVPFNEYEYNILEAAARKTGRTKLNYIRWAILKLAEDANKSA